MMTLKLYDPCELLKRKIIVISKIRLCVQATICDGGLQVWERAYDGVSSTITTPSGVA